jgi:ABC-2 type transport system permease protein
MRPKWQVALFFVFYIAIVFGVLGGMFFILATNLCGPMISLEVGWMYFLLMSLIALILGIFGSVFNTYAGLYLAKDNDLLLSLPIPVNVIITS